MRDPGRKTGNFTHKIKVKSASRNQFKLDLLTWNQFLQVTNQLTQQHKDSDVTK